MNAHAAVAERSGEHVTGPAVRERGWGGTVAALVACVAVAAAPIWPAAAGQMGALVRLVVPLEQTLLLVVPAVAACALVGWWAGGRLVLALAWVALAAWVLTQPVASDTAGYAALARGWAVLLAGAFGLVSFVAVRRPFFGRALAALGLTVAVTLGALLATGRAPDGVRRVMTAEYERRVDASLGAWRAHTADAGWQAVAARAPEVASRAATAADRLGVLPPVVATVVPALVALESLAALALAWALYHRLSRARLGPPLGTLRTFRFNDQLVWGLIAGLTMVLLPTLAPLRAVGVNVLLFFAALYALRGLGVLRWLAPERVAAFVALGLALLLPLLGVALLVGTLGAVAVVLGLGDTWGDWRSRRSRPTA